MAASLGFRPAWVVSHRLRSLPARAVAFLSSPGTAAAGRRAVAQALAELRRSLVATAAPTRAVEPHWVEAQPYKAVPVALAG